ncbi:Alkaline phosphatase [Thermodesulfobium narugense DSM 14796]|uniref:Alkaline phosphatase n=1 Tax=Thermodesulfobium narugense DSM 14796 TaxID=747365 RepID=M1E814_9BACT|nr:alkaline phosphatase [Thermodesulfobium narugense]AEE14878.1 Alkaline phosphatase [Thermodesulfobium narugense DSM 14796]
MEISRREAIKVFGATLATLLINPSVYANQIDQVGETIKFEKTDKPGIVFIVGDGMPISTLTALNSLRSNVGKTTTFYKKFGDPDNTITYMGTESLTSVVTDSAPASAAWATGSKGANHFLSVLPNGQVLRTIGELAKENGYEVGFVTTTRVTHATPAAWYSHNKDRDDEANIALDALVLKPDVLMGGGLKYFSKEVNPKLKSDTLSDFKKEGYQIFTTKDQLKNIDYSKTILGLFNKSHIDYYLDRLNDKNLDSQPSLALMSAVALKKLQQSKKGFVLQIEAGRIDHANHANDAYGAMMDTAELDQVLDVVDQYIKNNPKTLVIVTSDHGTGGFNVFGTGADYNDSTEAFLKYKQVKASIPYIAKKIDNKSPKEVQDIVEYYTGFYIDPDEAQMIIDSRSPEYNGVTGNYLYRAYESCALGAVLAKCAYQVSEDGDQKGKALLRRGNIYFVSTTHTGEDQVVMAYGYRSRELLPSRRIENTELYNVMLSFLNIKSYKNPTMSKEEARSYLQAYYKEYSYEKMARSLKLHVV